MAHEDCPEIGHSCQHVIRLEDKLAAALLQNSELRARLDILAKPSSTREDELRERLDSMTQLISAWQEYAAFLGVEVMNLSLFASVHGWKCPPETAAKGSELRRKLGVNDDWTLIEKRIDRCQTCGKEIPEGDCRYTMGSLDFCGRCGVPNTR